jgi:hypothetical protein
VKKEETIMKKTNMKTRKRLAGAVSMLLISSMMLGTATYAWFTMNDEVSVTGMSMKTTVESNLLIDDVAPCHGGTWSAGSYATNDSTFRSSTTQTIAAATLAPLSTTNGYNFFATSPTNVMGDGDAISEAYTAITQLSDLTGLGYTSADHTWLDYHFVLKAVNTDSANTKNINLSQLKMTFSKATDSEKAWRVAIHSKKFATATVDGAKTLPDIDASATGVTTHIYAPASATNFEANKAVTSTSATGAVTYASSASDATIGTVAAGATEYYEVVVRVWLEGEDKTCNVNTFQTLVDGTWSFETKFKLEAGTASGVYQITQDVTTT